ncbi:MAG: mucoidy inhibitor MuiA family protein [Bacteroidota bacterium]
MRIKKTFTIFLLLGLLSPQIQASDKEVESTITDVMVFLNGARITRNIDAHIPAGQSRLVFKGITSKLNPNSLQVSTDQGATILSVKQSKDYLEDAEVNEEISHLREERDNVKNNLEKAQSRQQVFEQEQKMLLSNQSVGGSETGISADQLKNVLDFFRNRMSGIEERLFELKNQMEPMKERLENLNKQLDELNDKKDQPQSTITVTITSDHATDASLKMNYIVDEARWIPFYNLRAEDINTPLVMDYKARIFQNTGEPWDKVNLSLSTGDPSANQTKPELNPWIIRPVQPVKREEAEKKKSIMLATEVQDEKAEEIPELVTRERQQTTTVFNINEPFSVKPNNKAHEVSVMRHETDANFKYVTVPKHAPHAFLMAELTEWNDFDLLPGQAAIYLGQSYQGKTFLDPYTAEDTLSLSMGRDPGITVSREVQKDYSSNTFFGNKQKKTKAWKISVRNNKNTEVDIVVEDQMPVSGDSDIKVELEESSGARVNRKTGLMEWQLSLEPGETRELDLVYSVQYPKDKKVILE